MEYNLSICQKAIADNFPSLDIKDAAIIDFSTRFSKSSKIQKKIEGQTIYYWFDYGKIASENPLLKLNSEAIRKRIRHLCELGIFDAHPLNRGGKVFFSFGANYEKTHKFDEKEREENPDVVKTAKRTGRKSRPQREENPDLLQKEREENPDNHNNHLNNHKNQEHKNQNNAALPLSEYPKAADIYPETFSVEAQQPEPTSPGGGAPGAIRVSITGPEHPDITVQDIIEPKTDAPKTGRTKPKNPRNNEPTIHPENETAFQHFTDPQKARAAWQTWIRYKAAEHRERYKSAETEIVKIRSLYKETNGDSAAVASMVENAIGNLWKGIHPLKSEKNGQQPNGLNAATRQHLNLAKDTYERWQRAFNGDAPTVDYITGAK